MVVAVRQPGIKSNCLCSIHMYRVNGKSGSPIIRRIYILMYFAKVTMAQCAGEHAKSGSCWSIECDEDVADDKQIDFETCEHTKSER